LGPTPSRSQNTSERGKGVRERKGKTWIFHRKGLAFPRERESRINLEEGGWLETGGRKSTRPRKKLSARKKNTRKRAKKNIEKILEPAKSGICKQKKKERGAIERGRRGWGKDGGATVLTN